MSSVSAIGIMIVVFFNLGEHAHVAGADA